MKNKELVLRRLESLESKMKRLRNALNERNVDAARQILQEALELRDDTQSIVSLRICLAISMFRSFKAFLILFNFPSRDSNRLNTNSLFFIFIYLLILL